MITRWAIKEENGYYTVFPEHQKKDSFDMTWIKNINRKLVRVRLVELPEEEKQ